MASRKTIVFSPPFLVGTATPVVWANLGHLLGIWSSDWMIVTLAALYLAVGFFMWRGTLRRSAGGLVIVYLSVPIGVFLSVKIDGLVWRYDRGIWLIEMVIVWGLALVPLVAGAVVARVTQPRARGRGS